MGVKNKVKADAPPPYNVKIIKNKIAKNINNFFKNWFIFYYFLVHIL